ncbi:MAG: hypothetical protein SOV26_00675 [Candidatus Onthovivens sp.]|nr:hypothetical protein [Candidatus Onthovivens sp.]
MKDHFFTNVLKFGLVLLIMNIIMLFVVQPGSAEWTISWVSFAIVLIFDIALIIYINVKNHKESKNE